MPERLHRVPSPYRPEEQETSHWFVSSVDQSDRSSTIHDGHSEDQTDHLGSSQSTVNSHGKLCIWCEQGTRIEQPNDYNDQGQHNHIEIIDNHDHSQEAEEQDQERQDRDHQLHDQDQQSYNGEGHHLNHDMAMQGVLAKDLPPLLYRWSNPDSQGVNSKTYYRAALFCNGEWFNPEDFSESRFLKYFRSHVSKEKTKTPFISTFRSPLAPIHRALANRNGAVVTVIDTSKLNTKVFYTAPLAVRTGIVALWRGYGEYLIWGHIPTEAIAFTVEITSLEDIANSHRDINRLMQIPLISNVKYCNYNLRDMLASRRKSPFKSGRTLGKLLTLLQVPMVYWDSISYRFARTWGWRCGEEITQFCSGLRSGEPYFAEELSDSEREVPLSTPLRRHRRTPSKNIPSIDFDSDLDYEPPETDEGSEGTSDSDGPNDSRSVSMCDKTETVDDENFSTHETLSSGIFPQDNGPDDLPEQPNTEDMMDGTSDDEDTCSQRALQRDWPSDDGTHPDTPTPMEMRIPRLFEDGPTLQVDFGGQMNMDLAERVRLWYHHENGSNM